jgi:hypothetical protein
MKTYWGSGAHYLTKLQTKAQNCGEGGAEPWLTRQHGQLIPYINNKLIYFRFRILRT